jgi:HTH-type transcriptional regulator, sugar sensing transcriptional regulator
VDQRIRKGVKNLIIASPNTVSTDWSNSSQEELREIKIHEFPYPDFSGDLKIYGNKIALASYKENFFAMVIDSKELATLHKNMFMLIWRMA